MKKSLKNSLQPSLVAVLTSVIIAIGCEQKEEAAPATDACSTTAQSTEAPKTEAALDGDTSPEATPEMTQKTACPGVISKEQVGSSGDPAPDVTPLPKVEDPIVTVAPGAFSISGTSGIAAVTEPMISWSASAGAATYAIKVATTATCATPVQEVNDLTGTNFMPVVPSDGTYFVCLTGTNPGGTTTAGNSGSWSFSLDSTGPLPLTNFAAQTTRSLGAMYLLWQAAASYADYDKLEFRVAAGATPPADCSSGSLMSTYTSFSAGPIGYTLYTSPGTVLSFRGCLYDELGNITTSNAMTATLTAATSRQIFVTSTAFDGNLKATFNGQTFADGYAGADYRCQHAANTYGLYGTWKALVGGEYSRDPWYWTRVGGEVYNLADELVATSKATLLSYNFALGNAVDVDETGTTISTNLKVWSGFSEGDDDGPSYGYPQCKEWTQAAGAYGYYGDPQSTGSAWLSSSGQWCDGTARLYCIQQETKPPLLTSFSAVAGGSAGSGVVTVDFPSNTYYYGKVKVYRMKGSALGSPNCLASATGATLIKTYDGTTVPFADDTINDTTGSEGHFSYLACAVHATDESVVQWAMTTSVFQSGSNFQRMFITSTSYNGNLGGLAGADTKCQSQADGASLGGTWKAVISATGTSASSRVAVTQNVFDILGNYVANNSGDMWDASIGGRGVRSTQGGTDVGSGYYKYWTGTTSSGGVDSDNCSNWTYGADSAVSGETGEAGKGDIYWVTFSGSGCNSSNSLLCIDGQ